MLTQISYKVFIKDFTVANLNSFLKICVLQKNTCNFGKGNTKSKSYQPTNFKVWFMEKPIK